MEFVFVAPREAVFPACYPQGFQRFQSAAEARAFLECLRETGFFVERARAERTPSWKQAIPYCVVAGDERILLMTRHAKGGESRLHGKLSIGVGGHINPVDGDGSTHGEDLVARAARREIDEELEVRGGYELNLFGYLNDDSNAVGAVHLGLVFVVNLMGSARIREEDVLEGHMVTPGELRELQGAARGESLETWSRILIPHLDGLVSVGAHSGRHHATTT